MANIGSLLRSIAVWMVVLLSTMAKGYIMQGGLRMQGGEQTAVDTRRGALLHTAKLMAFTAFLGGSLPAHAKRARPSSESNGAAAETREEREARIKRERAEYEERRRQAEVVIVSDQGVRHA